MLLWAFPLYAPDILGFNGLPLMAGQKKATLAACLSAPASVAPGSINPKHLPQVGDLQAA